MYRSLTFALLVGLAGPVLAQGLAIENPNDPEIQKRCKLGVEHMLSTGEQIAAAQTDPKAAERQRALFGGWKKRLEAGENPCTIYQDIAEKSRAF